MKVIRIGRDLSNDYVINHPAVSGTHADLYVYDNGAMQLVEHSTNGTYVNDSFVHNSTCYISGDEMLCFPDQCPIPVSKLLSCNAAPDYEAAVSNEVPAVMNDCPSEYSNPVPAASESNIGQAACDSYRLLPGMSFGATFGHYFKHYFDFRGRARRQEYWYIVIWNIIFAIIPLVNILWILATFIPGLALSVRRLHDTGKSGFWLLLHLIPLIGSIILLVWFFTDSKPQANRFGSSPKYVSI